MKDISKYNRNGYGAVHKDVFRFGSSDFCKVSLWLCTISSDCLIHLSRPLTLNRVATPLTRIFIEAWLPTF